MRHLGLGIGSRSSRSLIGVDHGISVNAIMLRNISTTSFEIRQACVVAVTVLDKLFDLKRRSSVAEGMCDLVS
jgi:hypothetical protein